MFYMITLFTMFVLTCSVWYVILFRETGVVHRITPSLSYIFLFLLVLFTNLILNINKKGAVSGQNQIIFY